MEEEKLVQYLPNTTALISSCSYFGDDSIVPSSNFRNSFLWWYFDNDKRNQIYIFQFSTYVRTQHFNVQCLLVGSFSSHYLNEVGISSFRQVTLVYFYVLLSTVFLLALSN